MDYKHDFKFVLDRHSNSKYQIQPLFGPLSQQNAIACLRLNASERDHHLCLPYWLGGSVVPQLKLRADHLAFKFFLTKAEIWPCVCSDEVVKIKYINNQWVMRSDILIIMEAWGQVLCKAVSALLRWAHPVLTSLRATHLPGLYNGSAVLSACLSCSTTDSAHVAQNSPTKPKSLASGTKMVTMALFSLSPLLVIRHSRAFLAKLVCYSKYMKRFGTYNQVILACGFGPSNWGLWPSSSRNSYTMHESLVHGPCVSLGGICSVNNQLDLVHWLVPKLLKFLHELLGHSMSPSTLKV